MPRPIWPASFACPFFSGLAALHCCCCCWPRPKQPASKEKPNKLVWCNNFHRATTKCCAYLQVVSHHDHEVHDKDAHGHESCAAHRVGKNIQPARVVHVDVVGSEAYDVAEADVVQMGIGCVLRGDGSPPCGRLWTRSSPHHARDVHWQQRGVPLAQVGWKRVVGQKPAPCNVLGRGTAALQDAQAFPGCAALDAPPLSCSK